MPESPSSRPIGHAVSPTLPVPNLIETGTRKSETRPPTPESRASNSLDLATRKAKANLEQVSSLQEQFYRIKKNFSNLMKLTKIIGRIKPLKNNTEEYRVVLNSKELELIEISTQIKEKNIKKHSTKNYIAQLKMKDLISIDSYIKNVIQTLKSERSNLEVKKYLDNQILYFSIIHNLCCLNLAFKSPQYVYDKKGLNDSPSVFISLICNDILDMQGLKAGKLIREKAFEICLKDFFLVTRMDSVKGIRTEIRKDLTALMNEYNLFKARVDACFRPPVKQDDENRIHNNRPDESGR